MEENTVLKIKICDGNHKSATLLACFIENFEICCLPSLTLSHVCMQYLCRSGGTGADLQNLDTKGVTVLRSEPCHQSTVDHMLWLYLLLHSTGFNSNLPV